MAFFEALQNQTKSHNGDYACPAFSAKVYAVLRFENALNIKVSL